VSSRLVLAGARVKREVVEVPMSRTNDRGARSVRLSGNQMLLGLIR
jgi:hypothetical protein